MTTIPQKIQKLNIVMFFDIELLKKYKKNRELVLSEWKIPLTYKKYILDPDEPAFEVESRGRRLMIVKEIAARFKPFLIQYTNRNDIDPTWLINQSIFVDFFRSDFFIENKKSFPHYTGAGHGFENSSKFFLFCLDNLSLCPSSKLELFTCMAIHLNFQAHYSSLGFFQPFKACVYFEIENSYYLVKNKVRVKIDRRIENKNLISLNEVVSQFSESMSR